MCKPGFDDADHPWIKLVLVTGVVLYGKIEGVKNNSKFLEYLRKYVAFDFWWPMAVSPVPGGKLGYQPVAGKSAAPGDFEKEPCLLMIRSNVVYSGVVTGEQSKNYDRAKQKMYGTIIMPGG